MQLPLRTERVHDPVRNHWHSTWTLVEAEVIPVGGRVRVTPLGGTRAWIERLDNLLARDSVEQDDSPLGHDRPAETLPYVLAPDDARPLGAPCLGKRRSAGHPVPLGTEELRPVFGPQRSNGRCEKDKGCETGNSTHGAVYVTAAPCARRRLFGSLRIQMLSVLHRAHHHHHGHSGRRGGLRTPRD